jgi:GT2 family glycosyltransferase
MKHKIIAITVTYNSGAIILPFLESVFSQLNSDYHLIIIDNNSTDSTKSILKSLNDPRLTVIYNPNNVGFATATNQGIKWALAQNADRVLLINNDTVFSNALFSMLDSRLDSFSADAITPQILFFDRPELAWYAGGKFVRMRGVMSFHCHYEKPANDISDKPIFVNFAPACCLLVNCTVFQKIGIFDENYFVYWEDSDFCWRMKLANISIVYDPTLSLLHKVSISTGGGGSEFSIRQIHRNQVYFIRKFHGQFWLWYTMAVMSTKAIVRMILRIDTLVQTRQRFVAMREGLGLKVEPFSSQKMDLR